MVKKFFQTVFAVSILLLGTTAGQAAFYTVNLNTDSGDPGTGGTGQYFYFCNCPPSTSVFSQVYHFAPGDVVDFGSLLIGSFSHVDNRSVPPGQTPIPVYFPGGYSYSFSEEYLPILPPVGGSLAPLSVVTVPLIFTIPDNADSIQIAWFGPVSYVPPVPELSTWAMLLIGFAVLGYIRFWSNKVAERPARVSESETF